MSTFQYGTARPTTVDKRLPEKKPILRNLINMWGTAARIDKVRVCRVIPEETVAWWAGEKGTWTWCLYIGR